MSWEATAHVLQLAERTNKRELSSTHVLVLLTLAARHHRDIRCAFGQYKRMEIDTHLDDDTIITAINYLEACDYVRVYWGPLPLKTRNGQPVMGNLYCFVGLDPEEGPNVDGVQPRRRLGGRPRTPSSGEPNYLSSVSPGVVEPGVTGKATRSETPNPPGLADETSSARRPGVSAPPTPPRLTGTKLTGEREPERKNIGKPVVVNSNEKDDRKNGHDSRANGDGKPASMAAQLPLVVPVPAAPKELVESVCPMGPHNYVGSYQEHLATDPRHKISRPQPAGRELTA